MPDRRDPSRICHDMFEMVMARVAAIVIERCHPNARDDLLQLLPACP